MTEATQEQQQIQQLNAEILAVKSTAFDMQAKSNGENNALKNQLEQMNAVNQKICNALGFESEQVSLDDVFERINSLNENLLNSKEGEKS